MFNFLKNKDFNKLSKDAQQQILDYFKIFDNLPKKIRKRIISEYMIDFEQLPTSVQNKIIRSFDFEVLPISARNKITNRLSNKQNKTSNSTRTIKAPLNVKLIQTLFKALAPYNDEIAFLLVQAKKTKHIDFRRVRQTITDSYPAPIGEALRKLFAGNEIDIKRLEQLILTYDITLQIITFASMAQLWDAIMNDKSFHVPKKQFQSLKQLFTLNEVDYSFDYFAILNEIDAIFKTHNITHYIKELHDLLPRINDGGDLNLPVLAILELKEELKKDILEDKLASYCLQMESFLIKLLPAFSFLVTYKLMTIKHLQIVKERNQPAVYKLNNVMLDRVTAGILDKKLEENTHADDSSVLLYKSFNNVDLADFLNLSPFIIDEHALLKKKKSQLFFFSHSNADEYIFQDPCRFEDMLHISRNHLEEVAAELENFKKDVFGNDEDFN